MGKVSLGPLHGHALGFNCAAGNGLRNVKNSNLFQPLHYTTLVGCRHEHCKLYMLQCGSIGPLPVSLLMQAGTLLFANQAQALRALVERQSKFSTCAPYSVSLHASSKHHPPLNNIHMFPNLSNLFCRIHKIRVRACFILVGMQRPLWDAVSSVFSLYDESAQYAGVCFIQGGLRLRSPFASL